MQAAHWQDTLLLHLSHIQISPYPLFLSWQPIAFALEGQDTREVMSLIKAGDILIRLLDHSAGHRLLPGTFNDIGFYAGAVTEQHLRQVAKIEYTHPYPLGEQMVFASQNGQTVLMDLIDFCRCDGLAILRFPDTLPLQTGAQPPKSLLNYFANPAQCLQTKADTSSKKAKKKADADETAQAVTEPELDAAILGLIKAESDLVQFLRQGKKVPFAKVFPMFLRLALRQLNPSCQFNLGMDITPLMHGNRLVYDIVKSLCWNYGIVPTETRIVFKKYCTITPDMFIDANLEEVWKKIG